MKSRIMTAMLGVLVLAAPYAARADKTAKGDKAAKPESSVEAEWARLSLRLELNDEQKPKVKAIYDAERARVDALRESMRVEFEKLRWQVDAKADEKDVAATIAAIGSDHRAIRDEHDKAEKQVIELLRPDQIASALLRGDLWPGPNRISPQRDDKRDDMRSAQAGPGMRGGPADRDDAPAGDDAASGDAPPL